MIYWKYQSKYNGNTDEKYEYEKLYIVLRSLSEEWTTTMIKNCFWLHSRKKADSMGLFKKKNVKKSYDRECMKPVIRASICTGEQVAGFKNIQTGKFEEIMLIKSPKDLDDFKNVYGITEEIEKEYWMLDEDKYAEGG